MHVCVALVELVLKVACLHIASISYTVDKDFFYNSLDFVKNDCWEAVV